MPLFLTQVDNWNTIRPEKYKKGANGVHGNYVAYGDYYLLNTNRIVDMTVKGSGSKFLYCQDPDDSRCSPDEIECGTSVAVIRTWHDAIEDSKFGTFPIYPNFDTTAATVDTTIEWENICMIYQTPSDFDAGRSHMVYYTNAWERKVCLINLNLIEVLALEYP
jgi:hypothetical protein